MTGLLISFMCSCFFGLSLYTTLHVPVKVDDNKYTQQRRRLHVAAHFGWPGHFGVAALSAD